MKIAIIGAGRVGRALAGGLGRGGRHDVVVGVRDPSDPRHRDLPRAASPADAVTGADVVVLAVPWDAVEGVVSTLDLGEAVIVDATNPLAAGARALVEGPDSGAELIARWAGSNRVVKAFNSTGAANLADPTYAGGRPMMPVAGDDPDAKAVVVDLADQLGFDQVDAGTLAGARELEHLALLWIRLAHQLGNGPGFAFSVLRR